MSLDRILVLNAGSSTLKWALVELGERVHQVEQVEPCSSSGAPRAEAGEGAGRAETTSAGTVSWEGHDLAHRSEQVRGVVAGLPAVQAAGHRLVHGGAHFHRAVQITPEVRAALAEVSAIDPLHTAAALAGIEAVAAAWPDLPQVAAFDTTFHAAMPEEAATYPLPSDWTRRWGLRRYGFHGLSIQYAIGRASTLLGALPRRLVVCHLGSGCSVTAVAGGRSADTTMGFTPLEGVMMATRSGSVDPGLLLHLLQSHGITPEELATALNERSGLAGVSGLSGDLRQVLAAAGSGERQAVLAYAMFEHSVRRAVGAMAAVLGGVDALIFTGGMGEHSARLRAGVAGCLGFAGLALDAAANEAHAAAADTEISAAGSRVRVLVIAAREELEVAAEVRRVLAG